MDKRDEGRPGVIYDLARGSAIQTVSGRLFYPRDPRASEVAVSDYVYSTSLLCRYNGHTLRFYAVLEHLVRAVDLYLRQAGVDDYRSPVLLHHKHRARVALRVLRHDLHEGVVGDMTSPMKGCVPSFKAVEDPVEHAFAESFGDEGYQADAAEVKAADLAIAAVERRDLMQGDEGAHQWPGLPAPSPDYSIPNDDPTYALLALIDAVDGPGGEGLANVDGCTAARIASMARRALALRPETWRTEWNARHAALQRAATPRPTASTCAGEIASLFAAEAATRGCHSQSAKAEADWRLIATLTPIGMYETLIAWYDQGQKLYDACAVVAEARPAIVRRRVAAWVAAGCAPTLATRQKVRPHRCHVGEGELVVDEVDAERATFRARGWSIFVPNEDVVPA